MLVSAVRRNEKQRGNFAHVAFTIFRYAAATTIFRALFVRCLFVTSTRKSRWEYFVRFYDFSAVEDEFDGKYPDLVKKYFQQKYEIVFFDTISSINRKFVRFFGISLN